MPSKASTSRKRLAKAFKALGLLLLFVIACGCLVFGIAGWFPPPMPRTTDGQPRVQSLYATMPDGTRLAVRLVLPPALGPDGRVPVIVESTRYGTLVSPRFLMRALSRLGLAKIRTGAGDPRVPNALDYARVSANARATGGALDAFLEAGYAYVAVSARGTGASFGHRPIECSREEVADLADIVEWIAKQPWSDGRVGAYGVSYSGNTAELAAAVSGPALLAAAPLYADYDPIAHNALPGGILNERLVRDWNAGNQAADAAPGQDLFFEFAPPVDGPGARALLKEAFASHATADFAHSLENLSSLDEELAPGYTGADIAPASYSGALEASARPLYIRLGWLDAATVSGALERYLRSSNPQELVIGPWAHGGRSMYDPLLEGGADGEPEPGALEDAQSTELVAYFDRAMGGERMSRSIRYYTFGEGAWKTSPTWPPTGFAPRRFWLGAEKRLAAEKPEAREAWDDYAVDFGANSGESSRWRTNLGGGVVAYPDRGEADERLLHYDSAPLERDLEITGIPLVSIQLESDRDDGAIFVYLESVSPDGAVRYLSEGLLRARHRRVASEDAFGGALGPRHTMREADAAPLVPGEPAELKIAMQATSVLLRAGERIRLAVAGQDASNFARVPASGEARMRIRRDAAYSSYLELPVRER